MWERSVRVMFFLILLPSFLHSIGTNLQIYDFTPSRYAFAISFFALMTKELLKNHFLLSADFEWLIKMS